MKKETQTNAPQSASTRNIMCAFKITTLTTSSHIIVSHMCVGKAMCLV